MQTTTWQSNNAAPRGSTGLVETCKEVAGPMGFQSNLISSTSAQQKAKSREITRVSSQLLIALPFNLQGKHDPRIRPFHLSNVDIWSRIVPCHGHCPMHCAMVSRVPWPPPTRGTTPPSGDQCLETLPNVPWGKAAVLDQLEKLVC